MLKGVGNIYVQVVVDAFFSLAFAKVYRPTQGLRMALGQKRLLPVGPKDDRDVMKDAA